MTGCLRADEHPLMLSCGSCDYLSCTARALVAEELNRWADDLDCITGARWIATAMRNRVARLREEADR